MAAEHLSDGLWWIDHDDDSVVAVDDQRGQEPVFRLSRAASRVRTELLFLSGRRAVDLSTRPAAILDVLSDRARGPDPDGTGWHARLEDRLHRRCREWSVWQPGSGGVAGALATLGGTTHPVLGLAYDAGVQPVREIPLWASPTLMQATAAEAARTAFGAKVTRPVIRAFAGCMAPTTDSLGPDRPEVQWWQVGIALAGSRVLEPDHIAAVLSAPARPSGGAPTNDDITDMRRALELLGPTVSARLAVDALSRNTGRHLLGVLRLFLAVRHDLSRQPPSRLDRLERACLEVARIDPGPRQPYPQRQTAPSPVERNAQQARQTDVDRQSTGREARLRPREPQDNGTPEENRRTPMLAIPRAAPVVRKRVVPQRFRYPDEIAALHGKAIGNLTLVLPWNAYELTVWSRSLQNCLGTFDRAVAAGKSVIVGVRRGRRLLGALELRPESRTIIQFLGRHNRPLPPDVVEPVVRYLRDTEMSWV